MLEKGAIPRFELIEINEAISAAFYALNVPQYIFAFLVLIPLIYGMLNDIGFTFSFPVKIEPIINLYNLIA